MIQVLKGSITKNIAEISKLKARAGTYLKFSQGYIKGGGDFHSKACKSDIISCWMLVFNSSVPALWITQYTPVKYCVLFAHLQYLKQYHIIFDLYICFVSSIFFSRAAFSFCLLFISRLISLIFDYKNRSQNDDTYSCQVTRAHFISLLKVTVFTKTMKNHIQLYHTFIAVLHQYDILPILW